MSKPRKPPRHRPVQSKTPINFEKIETETKAFFQQFVAPKAHTANIFGYVYGDKRMDYSNHEHVDVSETGVITSPASLSELYPVRQAIRNRNKMVVIIVEEETGEFSHVEETEDGEHYDMFFRNVRSWVILGDTVKPQSAAETEQAYLFDLETGDEQEANPANRFFDAPVLSAGWIK